MLTQQRRIAELAEYHQQEGLSTLGHYLDMEWMKEAYGRVRRKSAPGEEPRRPDWQSQKRKLQGAAGQAGAYPQKEMGRKPGPSGCRLLARPPTSLFPSAASVEDKILQRAVVMLLEPIYEREFCD